MTTKALLTMVVICAVFAHRIGYGQQVVMNVVEMKENQIVVHYDLNDLESHHVYSVSLFSSQDNFTTKLTKVSGDVGFEVSVGKDKQITWDISAEYGSFRGRLTFEVRAHVYVPFVKIKNIDEGRVFRRGKSYPIYWTSGNAEGKINIELYRGDKLVSGTNNIPNNGVYELSLPVSIAVGKNYKLKFSNSVDTNESKFSQPVTIKRKIPTGVKVLGVVVVAGGALILSGGKTPGPVKIPVDNNLPDAPGPP